AVPLAGTHAPVFCLRPHVAPLRLVARGIEASAPATVEEPDELGGVAGVPAATVPGGPRGLPRGTEPLPQGLQVPRRAHGQHVVLAAAEDAGLPGHVTVRPEMTVLLGH